MIEDAASAPSNGLAASIIESGGGYRTRKREIYSLLKGKGRLLIVEPKFFHVSKRAFGETVRKAEEVGFEPVEAPKVFFGRATVLRKS